MIEPDHVFCQLRKRDLRLQHVLLRNLSGGVLDARLFNSLARNGHMLIVNLHLVVGEQQVIEGLMHTHQNVQASLLQIGLYLIHARLCNTRAQCQLSPSRQSLADAEHVLGLVVVPRLIERDSPTAVHRHGIVERAGDGHVRFSDGDSPCRNHNLRIRRKGDPLRIFKREG